MIKSETITFCRKHAKEKRSETNNFEERLKLLNSKNNVSANEENEIDTLKRKIDLLYEEKAKGAQIRAREKWLEQGEKNTKYFLGLEKQRQAKSVIRNIKDETGSVVSEPSDVLKTIHNFYEKLYKSVNISKNEIDEYVHNTELDSMLTDNESRSCDGYITNEESTKAIF